MRLRVLSVAFPFAPVGSHGVGGAEKILADLDRALTAAGHESVVVACRGSEISGTLIPVDIPTDAARDPHTQAAARRRVQAAIDAALVTHAVDLVHMHGLDFHEYAIPAGIPVLVTLHLPLAWYPLAAWSFREPVQLCCVSQSQLRTAPPQLRNPIVIENGVEVPAQSLHVPKKDFALAAGRICPEKNAHEALQAGTQAGVPVYLAGQVFPYREHQQYFAEKIQPLLASGFHRFLGPVEPQRMQSLLASARCLLHPTLAPETSSLIAMEALAAGTPVIAYRSGALPEIIENGVTGFLVDTMKQMADAIRNAHRISPRACRAAAAHRFNQQRMIDAYFARYAALACSHTAETLHA